MIRLKSKEDIKILEEGGQILSNIIEELISKVKPGVVTSDLDSLAIELAKKYNAKCSFLGYNPSGHNAYPAALCASINNEVVHGLGNLERELKEGDIVGLDMGLEYKGLFTDMARTVGVGKISDEAKGLIKVTKRALQKGIEQVKNDVHIHKIGRAIQNYVEGNGYSIVRDLVGHGVGYAVHEDPMVPNFDTLTSQKLKTGMVIAIEPMVNIGTWQVVEKNDGWTIKTKDGKLSAHFEDTVVVLDNGYKILTR